MLTINGYELLEKAGEGGMATVWKARQLSLDRIVAIKVLSRSSLPNEEAIDNFRREAQGAAKLNHPGIVQVFDTGETDDGAYLIMEYVDGITVGDLILKEHVLSEAKALEIADQAARALAYAWEKECLIHCDIKPDNLLIDRASGLVKVADLGLARIIGPRTGGRDETTIIGTPHYIAPEQAAGLTDLDCRTDMYALGATLYHMLTGTLPFRNGGQGSEVMDRHEWDFLEDPQTINPSLSAPVAWLIEKMMIKNRALRPHFWTQVLKDIEAVRSGNMPFPPLPEEGASTVRRAATRIAFATPKTKPAAGPAHITPSAAPRKLTVRKSEMTSTLDTTSYRPKSNPVVTIIRSMFSILLPVAAVYAVLMYHSKVPTPAWFPQHEAPATPPAEIPTPTETTVAEEPGETSTAQWHSDDFVQGARLFNQSLADFKEYQQTRENPGILGEIESNLRDAIAFFEAARDSAPPHIPIGQYIDQCNAMIFNVRQSTVLTPEPGTAPRDPGIVIQPLSPEPAASSPRRSVVFVDDETVIPVTTPNTEPTAELTRIALSPGWDRAGMDTGGIGRELRGLLARHAEPSTLLMLDPTVALFPGITATMNAPDAAAALGQALPIRRPLTTPGLPNDSLYVYTFEGDFGGARELAVIVDGNNRVVMIRIYDDRPSPARMEQAFFSPHRQVIDFVTGRTRPEGEGLIAHRVRAMGNVIRIDTEYALNASGERTATARSQLLMPTRMAGLILSINP